MNSDERASVVSKSRLTTILSKIKGFFRKVDHDKSGNVDATVFVEMLRLHNIHPVVDTVHVSPLGQVNYIEELAKVVKNTQNYKTNDLVSVLDWDGLSIAPS